MGEVKTPGQIHREAWDAAAPEWWTKAASKQKPPDWALKCDEAAAQAVLAADPVRTQALELVHRLAVELGRHMALTTEEDVLIEDAFEFVRKAREASKP